MVRNPFRAPGIHWCQLVFSELPAHWPHLDRVKSSQPAQSPKLNSRVPTQRKEKSLSLLSELWGALEIRKHTHSLYAAFECLFWAPLDSLLEMLSLWKLSVPQSERRQKLDYSESPLGPKPAWRVISAQKHRASLLRPYDANQGQAHRSWRVT